MRKLILILIASSYIPAAAVAQLSSAGGTAAPVPSAWAPVLNGYFGNPVTQATFDSKYGSDAPLAKFARLDFRRNGRAFAFPIVLALEASGVTAEKFASEADKVKKRAMVEAAFLKAAEATAAHAEKLIAADKESRSNETELRALAGELKEVADIGALYLDPYHHWIVGFSFQAAQLKAEAATRARLTGKIEKPTQDWLRRTEGGIPSSVKELEGFSIRHSRGAISRKRLNRQHSKYYRFVVKSGTTLNGLEEFTPEDGGKSQAIFRSGDEEAKRNLAGTVLDGVSANLKIAELEILAGDPSRAQSNSGLARDGIERFSNIFGNHERLPELKERIRNIESRTAPYSERVSLEGALALNDMDAGVLNNEVSLRNAIITVVDGIHAGLDLAEFADSRGDSSTARTWIELTHGRINRYIKVVTAVRARIPLSFESRYEGDGILGLITRFTAVGRRHTVGTLKRAIPSDLLGAARDRQAQTWFSRVMEGRFITVSYEAPLKRAWDAVDYVVKTIGAIVKG